MNSLCVFSTGDDLNLLEESCSNVNITLHRYYTESLYQMDNLRGAIMFLTKRREPFAMLVHSDSLVLKDEATIMSRVRALGNPVVMSAECLCYPDGFIAEKYPAADIRLPPGMPKYLNSSCIIGPLDVMLTAMYTALMYATCDSVQGAWTAAYIKGAVDLQIDHGRWLFAHMGDGPLSAESDSCVKHWDRNHPGREEYYNEWLNSNRRQK